MKINIKNLCSFFTTLILLLNFSLATVKAENSLTDKTIIFMGDSITENFEKEKKSYPDIVREETGAYTINLGLGGTSMSTHPNEFFNAFSFYNLVDAMITKDYSKQESAISNKDIPDYFKEKLNTLSKTNLQEVDIMVVLYGANDWGKPLENREKLDDVNTFKGSLKSSLIKLYKNYPHLQFLLVPTPYRYWPEYGGVDSFTSTNNIGLHPYQYSLAMNEIGQEFNIPVADTLYGLGINANNREFYFKPSDGTHFNEVGVARLAELITNTLNFYY